MNEPRDHLDDPELPDALKRALRRLDEPRRALPPAVDGTVLVRAGLVARRRSPAHRRLRRLAVATAAAAALVVFFLTTGNVPLREDSRDGVQVSARRVAVREDVDRSGRVDVLDAFLLARALRDGLRRPEYDVDGDGSFDGSDVEVVTGAVVRLEDGG